MKKRWLLLLFAAISVFSYAQYQQAVQVEPLLKTDTTVIGQKIKYPVSQHPEVTISRVTIPPGISTGWHKHSVPVFAYMEQGTLNVQLEDSSTNTFAAGSSFAEVVNTYHNGTNKGKIDVVLIAIYLGGDSTVLSQKMLVKKAL
jgi:quercetin dioxygenase-like cupin family protein